MVRPTPAEVKRRPALAVTGGDPCGVGPEVILKALTGAASLETRLLIIGDLAVFEQTARRLRLRLPRWKVASSREPPGAGNHPLVFVDCAHRGAFQPGRVSGRAGAASAVYLDLAIGFWRQGLVNGLVTAPVTKQAVRQARNRFSGQTEYLASALGARCPVMMFVSPRLRVVLLTRHLPLRAVAAHATPTLLRQTVTVTVDGLRRWFRIRRPRLAVCGVNPHAGEGGLFGDEERRVLLPVLRHFHRKRVRLDGPFAADGFFARLVDAGCGGSARGYDAVVCWYHDQGLIPFKLMARDLGCQMTLGLPLVRTSPDHGSALDIAGTGRAHPGSMRYALHLASRLVQPRAR